MALSVSTNKALILLSQVDGRDKVYKTCQYGARLAWWILQTKGADTKLLSKLSGLDSSFSDARRVFKLGNFCKEIKDLVKEPFLQGNKTFLYTFRFFSTLCSVLGELMDVMIYASKIKAININRGRWEWWRSTLLMVNLLYAFTDQIILMKQTLEHRKHLLEEKKRIDVADRYTTTTYDNNTTKEVKAQIAGDIVDVNEKVSNIITTHVRYGCDFVLCSAQLCDWEHKGLFGLLGVVGAVIGLKQAWKKL